MSTRTSVSAVPEARIGQAQIRRGHQEQLPGAEDLHHRLRARLVPRRQPHGPAEEHVQEVRMLVLVEQDRAARQLLGEGRAQQARHRLLPGGHEERRAPHEFDVRLAIGHACSPLTGP
jgi:hypothetical protein